MPLLGFPDLPHLSWMAAPVVAVTAAMWIAVGGWLRRADVTQPGARRTEESFRREASR